MVCIDDIILKLLLDNIKYLYIILMIISDHICKYLQYQGLIIIQFIYIYIDLDMYVLRS
nr:hypothetical protein CJLB15_00066 [Campylobacter phage CJLB-15]